jgi:sulfoxide reductase heme-binding subunit YedZ
VTLWYITRATGVVALVLLTVTVTLGLANAARLHSTRIPRFAINGVHRNASLLAVCFVAAHVVTVLADGYVSIPVASVLVPFTSGYKPFWVGLGTVSLDLLAAVMATSILRKRIGHRAWRATHWLAYGSWPVAVIHSVGTGTDAGSRWMLVITTACVASTLAAFWIRIRSRSRQARHRQTPARRPQPTRATPVRVGTGYELRVRDRITGRI